MHGDRGAGRLRRDLQALHALCNDALRRAVANKPAAAGGAASIAATAHESA